MADKTTPTDMEIYIKGLLDYAAERWPDEPDQWRRFAQDHIRDRLMMDDMEEMLTSA